ncbi:hypothetical protein HHL16_19165 [Pseudoflavitalea sp. G-6-1-2]|uniref:hypothetical protein n=1 Tax=Pseudoflavitalea sp. G-6-1-2 TaxID=2728841 RepID=UPI00146EBCAB|nr:hypothetical protein [Pseudoflavitalea sp. G-6-1-2]NML23006.1 hypothetical protein [Pseudoflavitalea sp. G-6-1-2]
MKKNLLGTLAIVIAIIVAAFSAPAKRILTYVQFVGNPAILSQVQDQTLWQEAPSIPNCDGVNRKACRIRIDNSKLTTIPGPPHPKVLNGAMIQLNVAHGIDGVYYIPTSLSGSPGPYTITNRN